jgi:hypothetical protein
MRATKNRPFADRRLEARGKIRRPRPCRARPKAVPRLGRPGSPMPIARHRFLARRAAARRAEHREFRLLLNPRLGCAQGWTKKTRQEAGRRFWSNLQMRRGPQGESEVSGSALRGPGARSVVLRADLPVHRAEALVVAFVVGASRPSRSGQAGLHAAGSARRLGSGAALAAMRRRARLSWEAGLEAVHGRVAIGVVLAWVRMVHRVLLVNEWGAGRRGRVAASEERPTARPSLPA